MCLSRISERKIATEDIVVYKFLSYNYKIIHDHKYLVSGNDCVAIIKGVKVVGKISKGNSDWYICHNNSMFEGFDTPQKYGFKYSWVFDQNVSSLVIKHEEVLSGGLVTPYRNYPVVIGETYQSDLVVVDDRGIGNEVEVGLHSFKHESDCKKFDLVLVKCIIPKGSEYYEGFFKDYESYASNQLKYVEVCA
jgi:hypothetical protein